MGNCFMHELWIEAVNELMDYCRLSSYRKIFHNLWHQKHQVQIIFAKEHSRDVQQMRNTGANYWLIRPYLNFGVGTDYFISVRAK